MVILNEYKAGFNFFSFFPPSWCFSRALKILEFVWKYCVTHLINFLSLYKETPPLFHIGMELVGIICFNTGSRLTGSHPKDGPDLAMFSHFFWRGLTWIPIPIASKELYMHQHQIKVLQKHTPQFHMLYLSGYINCRM